MPWHGGWHKVLTLGALLILFGFLTDFGWDVVAAQRQSAHALAWETRFDVNAEQAVDPHWDAESMLREVQQRLSVGQRAQALGLAQDLVARYPHFQLGQLLFADLLSMTSAPTDDDRRVTDSTAPERVRKLQQLNHQAQLRLARPEPLVYKGKEPAGLAFLSPKVPFVILVDALHSRLYVMGHTAQEEGLKVIFESYMSVGQRGVGKQQKGDGKTPLGLYFIQRAYPGHALPDLYGAGALTLNYPNDLDVIDGKTGSGIWLHGSPSEEFSRAPEASDGCVVLTNPDMAFLMRLQLPVGTPVFIQQQIDWVEPQKNQALRAQLWPTVQEGSAASGEVLALFKWQSDGRKMMATITSSDNTTLAQASALKSDYWMEQARQWRAVSTPSEDVSKGDRASGGVRSTKRRSSIEVSQLQIAR